MRHLILVPVFFLFFLTHTHAQNTFKSETYLGLSGGVGLSRVSFTPYIKQDLLTSESIGLILRHISEPHLGLQFEAVFSSRGWIEQRDSAGTYKRELKSLVIPVMAVVVAGSKLVRFSFTLGPYVSYIRDEKETISTIDSARYRPYYLLPLHNKWEFGLTAGIGIEFHTKLGVFALKGAYSNSLTNIFPLNVSEFYYQASRMQAIDAGFAYMIRF
jgi:hypothetical protein